MARRKGSQEPKVKAANQGSESTVAKPFIPLARLMLPAMSALDDFDWMSVEAPVALPPDREADKAMEVKMDHSWEAYVPAKVKKAWKAKNKGILMEFVECHPVETPAAVIVAPCKPGTDGAIPLATDRSGYRIRLQNALFDYKLTWPKNQKIVFPVLIKQTKYGWSLIIDVAGKDMEEITPINKDDSAPAKKAGKRQTKQDDKAQSKQDDKEPGTKA